jgi:hypothetical protein
VVNFATDPLAETLSQRDITRPVAAAAATQVGTGVNRQKDGKAKRYQM